MGRCRNGASRPGLADQGDGFWAWTIAGLRGSGRWIACFGVGRCAPEFEGERFRQNAVGLHHLCFRARSRADVDLVHHEAARLGARIVHPPEEGGWAPGYYSVLFEDPVGTRLEVNHVPGKGVLADGVSFNPGTDYR